MPAVWAAPGWKEEPEGHRSHLTITRPASEARQEIPGSELHLLSCTRVMPAALHETLSKCCLLQQESNVEPPPPPQV